MTKINDMFGTHMPRFDDEAAWRSITALLELRLRAGLVTKDQAENWPGESTGPAWAE